MGESTSIYRDPVHVAAWALALHGRWLLPDERVLGGYECEFGDLLFTDRRLIMYDSRGWGPDGQDEYHTVPYRSISHFAITTTDHCDHGELLMWLHGSETALCRRFHAPGALRDVQALLAELLGESRIPDT